MLLDFFCPYLQIKLKLPEPHLNYDFKIFISLLLGGEKGHREGAAIAEGSHFSLRNMESYDYVLSLNFGICHRLQT